MVGAFLVMAATDDPEVQDQVLADTERHNIILNVADVPDKCSFILPAQVKRGDLSIAISTSGNSPALAKHLRRRLERQFGPEYEVLNNMMGLLRPIVLGRNLEQAENERIFNRILEGDILLWIAAQDWPSIRNHLEEAAGRPLTKEISGQLQAFLAVNIRQHSS